MQIQQTEKSTIITYKGGLIVSGLVIEDLRCIFDEVNVRYEKDVAKLVSLSGSEVNFPMCEPIHVIPHTEKLPEKLVEYLSPFRVKLSFLPAMTSCHTNNNFFDLNVSHMKLVYPQNTAWIKEEKLEDIKLSLEPAKFDYQQHRPEMIARFRKYVQNVILPKVTTLKIFSLKYLKYHNAKRLRTMIGTIDYSNMAIPDSVTKICTETLPIDFDSLNNTKFLVLTSSVCFEEVVDLYKVGLERLECKTIVGEIDSKKIPNLILIVDGVCIHGSQNLSLMEKL
jgi:hypothetical protein